MSVVVPVFAGEEFLSQCVESLLEQTHRKLEIILVDDGSPDRSGVICDGYARRDRRVRVIHKPNGGLVSARKVGSQAATGDYLGFVDGDDWVSPDFYESLHAQAAAASADLVVAGHVREFLGKHETISPRMATGVYDRGGIVDALLPTAIYNGVFFQHGVSTYVWNKLFKRETARNIIQQIPPEIVMGEDACLVYPYLAACDRVVVSGESGYFYRQRPHSILKSVPDLNVEYARLSALFRHLRAQLESVGGVTNMADQLLNYFYAQILVRSGGVLESSSGDWYSPFPRLAPGKKVVVYSTGSFGQQLVKALERLGTVPVVGWVDVDVHESQRLGLPVMPLQALGDLDFDLLLIAAIDSSHGDSLLPLFETVGVSNRKITPVSPNFELMEDYVMRIGFDKDTFAYNPAGPVNQPMRWSGEGDLRSAE